jgi:two-component system cell cycle response regulator
LTSAPWPKLLCVDDETNILAALERLLKAQFQVLIAGDAHDGLKLLQENPDCAVVLSDYQMPGLNGVEFLRQARQIAPNTVRAILSGQIDLQQVSEAINNHDIHKLFLKPWENDYFLVQMMEAVQLHLTLGEKAHFEQLAITDPVTQLTNHRFFQNQLRHEIQVAESSKTALSLVILDVDHFKAFNDRFGHPDGDRLLTAIARLLTNQVAGQGFVSRYGGEEFTLILPRQNMSQAFVSADKIRKLFESTAFTGLVSSPAYITASAGLASYPDHGLSADALIEAADRALYQAKRQGRNQVVRAPLGTGCLRR